MILPEPLALNRLAAAFRLFNLGMDRFKSTQSTMLLWPEAVVQAFPLLIYEFQDEELRALRSD